MDCCGSPLKPSSALHKKRLESQLAMGIGLAVRGDFEDLESLTGEAGGEGARFCRS